MNIQCPSCAKAYKLPDEKVKGQGVKVKCKQCESTFIVRPDGTATLEGAPAAPAGPVSYALSGPGGAKLGPFPLETVKARIEVGEITREWQAGPVGQPLRPIAELPEFADVEWPAIGADDDFGFGGGAEAPAAPPAGGDDFGFDDFASSPSAPAAASASGGDDFGFDDFSGGAAAAPSTTDGGDDFGFGDEPASSANAPAGDDDFGFGDEAASFSGTAAPEAGGDDFGFDDFGDAPAPSAPAAPASGGDDFGFDDFGDAPAPSAPAAAAGGDDFGGFGDFVDEPAKAPAAGNALDALFDEPAGGEIDEGAFGFDDEAGAPEGGDKVFYEEDFDHAFGDEVVRQVEEAADAPEPEAPAAPEAIYGWQDDTAATADSAGSGDDELITTLEQLSKTKPKSKAPLLIAAAVPLALAGLVAGLIFGLPGVARNLPVLGPIVLDVHESMNSEFHRQRILGELLGEAMPKIESWVPSQVASGAALLETVVRDVPDRLDVVDTLARARFFLALAGARPAPSMPQGTPVAAAYAAALAGGEVPAVVDPASDRMLAAAYLDWQADRVTEAVEPLTRATGLGMPQRLFVAVLRANIESSRGAATAELAAWQAAQEAAPGNPWVSLRTAWSIWRQGNRPAETRAAVEEARKQIALFDSAEAASLHELAARVALFEGKHPEALKETQAGLAKQPKNAVLLALKGRAHIEQKQWAEANLVLDDALAVDPKLPEAIVAKADALIGIDRGDEGLAMLEAATAEQPEVALLPQRLLAVLIERNRLDQAEVVYERAAARFPDDSTIVRLGADVALARNDIEAAQKRLDIFREANPNDMSVIVKLAEISLRRGQLDVAEKRLREIAEGDSRNVPARVKLGEILLLRGRPDEAEKILLDARDLASDNPMIYGHLARAYLDRDDPKAALEMLQEGMRLNASIWMLHLLTGEALFMQGKTNDAIYAFDKAAEISDGAVPVLLWQAKGYAASGRPGKALDFYREVLAKEPENLEALRQLTVGEMQVDQWDAAREVADTWRKVAPGSAEPYLWGGRARLLKGDVDDAIKILESGARRSARSAELQSELGWAWLQKKQISKAASHLGQARKLAPKDGLVLLRIGYLYKAQNRVSDARKAFEAAMKAEISDEDKARAKTELDTLAY